MNWGVTSKAMESDLAIELLNKTSSENHCVSSIICDQDATTMAEVKKHILFEVGKHSDTNHAKKSVGNDLNSLQKTHKILQTKVIAYLQKCFSYAIRVNRNKTE